MCPLVFNESGEDTSSSTGWLFKSLARLSLKRCSLRNNTSFFEVSQDIHKHFLGIYGFMKTEATSLRSVRKKIVILGEDEVAETPR